MADRLIDRGKKLLKRGIQRTSARKADAKPAYTDRWHLQHVDECVDYLVTRTAYLAQLARTRSVLAIGKAPQGSDVVVRGLRDRELQVEYMATERVAKGEDPQLIPGAIVCVDLDSRGIEAAARACLRHPRLHEAPFEYATATAQGYSTLLRHDDPNYSEAYFHSPLLVEPLEPFEIYERSLKLFDKKCDIRDYMDLFQVITEIVRLNIQGDVAEFGSFQGHSGYLIAATLAAAGSKKHVSLFDAFESFPAEPEGIDVFWSNSCVLDFKQVQAKFASTPNVTLVKGEFTKTLPEVQKTPLALAHIDCDSYRGIRYVTQQIYSRVSPGGFFVFEDYGHPALLGARLAVEDFTEAHPECMRWFSQFSGLYIAQKPR